MAYVGAATSLVQSGTLRVPTGDWSRADSTSALSYWPPGYPAAIALPMELGATPIQGGRYVNVVAAAVTAAALCALVSAAVGGGTGLVAGVVVVLVVFATPAVFDVHLSVLSEPLFIACLTLTVAVMAYARDRLLLLGLLATATVMVRYAGVCAPAAVVCWTLLDDRFAMRRRWRRAMVVALVPALAIVAWVARTALAKDRHGTPEVSVYGHWGGTLRQAGATIAHWLAPLIPDGTLQTAVAAVATLVLLVLVVATVYDTGSARLRQDVRARVSSTLAATLLMALWYMIVVCASRLFVGGTIPFDGRILSPLIVLVELAVVVSAAYWWRAYHRPVHVLIVVLALAWGGASATITANDASDAVTDGSDFAATEWRDSPLVDWVRRYGRGHTLYSNWPPAVYFHTRRIARELPDTMEVRHDLSDFTETLRQSNGLIVGFRDSSPDVVAPDSLAKLLKLHPVARFPDGTVWGP